MIIRKNINQLIEILCNWLKELLKGGRAAKKIEKRTHILISPGSDVLFERLNKETDRFLKEALAYHLYLESARHRLGEEARQKLKSRFGEVLSEPFLQLSQVFTSTQEYSMYEQIITRWLSMNNCKRDPTVEAGTQLKEFLIETAREKAQKEIRKYYLNPPKN